jgi:hypothetical protein
MADRDPALGRRRLHPTENMPDIPQVAEGDKPLRRGLRQPPQRRRDLAVQGA